MEAQLEQPRRPDQDDVALLQQGDQRLFDATLSLQRKPLSTALLRREALSFPFMVLRTLTGIYWQALRLLIKRIPLFDHSPTSQSVAAHPLRPVKESRHETEQI